MRVGAVAIRAGKLRNQLALLGVALTWLVGGVIGLVGYRQMTEAVRHEALARVEEAVRVGQRLGSFRP